MNRFTEFLVWLLTNPIWGVEQFIVACERKTVVYRVAEVLARKSTLEQLVNTRNLIKHAAFKSAAETCEAERQPEERLLYRQSVACYAAAFALDAYLSDNTESLTAMLEAATYAYAPYDVQKQAAWKEAAANKVRELNEYERNDRGQDTVIKSNGNIVFDSHARSCNLCLCVI